MAIWGGGSSRRSAIMKFPSSKPCCGAAIASTTSQLTSAVRARPSPRNRWRPKKLDNSPVLPGEGPIFAIERAATFTFRSGERMAHRTFKERPTPLFEAAVRDFVRKTGRPEDHPDLCYDDIAKNEPFIKLCPIDVDAKQRPEGDRVDCPMCTPNKFLSGFLCWFFEKQFCAVIGHCCADSETGAEADRRYRAETKKRHEEDYLLLALPLVLPKLHAIGLMKPSAVEALRLYRLLRKSKAIHVTLRDIARDNGRLRLQQRLEDIKTADGPAGYRRGNPQFREIDFGPLHGLIATLVEYNPVKELEWIERTLASLSLERGDEQEAMNFICRLDDKLRHVSYHLLMGVDDKFEKFRERLADFVSFFGSENLHRLRQWGGHEVNPTPIQVIEKKASGRRHVTISGRGTIVSMCPAPALWQYEEVRWPETPSL